MNDLLIKKIVEDVLQQINGETRNLSPSKPRILVVHPATKSSKEQVAELREWWEVEEADLASAFEEGISPLVSTAAFLEADSTLLAKGALGIADTVESQWLSHLLRQGVKTYLIPGQGLSSLLNGHPSQVKNPPYAQLFINYRNVLSEFGVAIASVREMVQAELRDELPVDGSRENRFHGKLISQKIVQSWAAREIKVPRGSIITPLARDEARQKGIKITIMEE